MSYLAENAKQHALELMIVSAYRSYLYQAHNETDVVTKKIETTWPLNKVLKMFVGWGGRGVNSIF